MWHARWQNISRVDIWLWNTMCGEICAVQKWQLAVSHVGAKSFLLRSSVAPTNIYDTRLPRPTPSSSEGLDHRYYTKLNTKCVVMRKNLSLIRLEWRSLYGKLEFPPPPNLMWRMLMLKYKIIYCFLNTLGARLFWDRMFCWNKSAYYFETKIKTFHNWNGL